MLFIILIGVGWSDFCYGKIPNAWIFIGAMLGILWNGTGYLGPAGMVLLVSFVGYRLRIVGAGDGKLMSLIAGYLGMHAGLIAIGAGLFIGGLWSLGILLYHRNLRIRLNYLSAYLWRVFLTKTIISYGNASGTETHSTIPLGTCLSAGTVLFLLYSYVVSTGGIL